MVRTLVSIIATSLSMGCVPGGFGDGYPRGGNIDVTAGETTAARAQGGQVSITAGRGSSESSIPSLACSRLSTSRKPLHTAVCTAVVSS